MQSRQERFGEPLQARPISRHVAGRKKIESLRSIDHEHIFVGRYRASARLPFWFRSEASQKAKNLWRKRATVARYSMLYRFLCNVMQRASQSDLAHASLEGADVQGLIASGGEALQLA